MQPWRFRPKSFVHHLDHAGLRAVPIIALICFLIGAVVMQQGVMQLKPFGAEPFAVNMVAILALREVGILLTAIMVAGRSGSAFTAEIGLDEDARGDRCHAALGIDPMDTLVLPRVLALIVALPLAFIGDITGLMGGGVMAIAVLGLDVSTYIDKLHETVDMQHFMAGMIKAPFAALIIGLVGCLEGMSVAGSAESLGKHVTSAVVKAIFLVIILDAVFAMFLSERSGCDLAKRPRGSDQRPRARQELRRLSDLGRAQSRRLSRRDPRHRRRLGPGQVGAAARHQGWSSRTGDVELFGRNAKSLTPQDRVDIESRWGILFQDGALFSSLTVLPNIQVPMREHLELPQAMMDDLAFLTRHGRPAAGRAPTIPSELSGGMRKRAGLARRWRSTPRSCSSTSPRQARPDRRRGLRPPDSGCNRHLASVYMVTHDLDTIFTVCERVAVLADKRIVRTGSPIEAAAPSQSPLDRGIFLPRAGARGAIRRAAAAARGLRTSAWKPKPTI